MPTYLAKCDNCGKDRIVETDKLGKVVKQKRCRCQIIDTLEFYAATALILGGFAWLVVKAL